MNQRTVGYPSTSWASCILMTSCGTETETNGESWTIRLLLQPSVSGIAVSLLVSGLTVDILSTFCGVLFMLQCVMLMLRIFEFGVLLFDCFVHRQNVTCLKRFYQVWAYAGEVEDIIIGRLAVVCSVTAEKLQRLAAVWWRGLMMCSWHFVFVPHRSLHHRRNERSN